MGEPLASVLTDAQNHLVRHASSHAFSWPVCCRGFGLFLAQFFCFLRILTFVPRDDIELDQRTDVIMKCAMYRIRVRVRLRKIWSCENNDKK